MSGRLKWYAARLMAMSPAEIAHRFGEVWRKRRLAGLTQGWAAFDDKQTLSHGFPALRLALAEAAPGRLDDIAGGARYLGFPAAAFRKSTGATDWLLDPVSGRNWPGRDSPAFNVDVRSTSATPNAARPYGDVKFVWEPNRLQLLQALAPLVAAAGEEGASARALGFEILASWMEDNPPYRGVNWISGIELSLRLVSLLLFLGAMEQGTATEDECRLASRFILAHAHMLDALPSLHSSANNHRIAEGLGLYVAGRLLPETDRRFRYVEKGRAILEAETLNQIHADGVGAEQSPTYQAFSMEMVALAALLEKQAGKAFPEAALERLKRGAAFLGDLQLVTGEVPAIGDDDEGRTLLWPHRDEPLYVASVAACVAALDGSVIPGARPGYFRERLFGVNPIAKAEHATGLRRYDAGGYSVIRHAMPAGVLHLTFDHGPLGYLSLAAHGHADALALWLALDDRPIFVDAGAWLYHSGEAIRTQLRSSRAHNTLSIRGASQSEPSAAFSWSSKAAARRMAPDAQIAGAADYALGGEHDGYRKRFGVIHRRDVVLKDGKLCVADRLEGARSPLDVEIGFLCAPGLGVVADSGSVTVNAGAARLLTLRAPDGFDLSIEEAPYSPRFGELMSTARILLRGSMASQPCVTAIDFGTS